ncbi:MAG TPA: hypothetical protein ACHBX6_02080 [Arsenophonus nasoniae]|uniref:hypothetical protein n=1 Tax=Arsenophonus nasoniae TaxID=638 RepID=UPI00387A52A9
MKNDYFKITFSRINKNVEEQALEITDDIFRKKLYFDSKFDNNSVIKILDVIIDDSIKLKKEIRKQQYNNIKNKISKLFFA